MAEPIIKVENLYKNYGTVEALRGVSFAVEQGEVFGLLGPNGAGKTSTVEILEGMRIPDRGSARVCGLDPEKSVIFRQSDVPGHAELHLVLSCYTPLGWLALFGIAGGGEFTETAKDGNAVFDGAVVIDYKDDGAGGGALKQHQQQGFCGGSEAGDTNAPRALLEVGGNTREGGKLFYVREEFADEGKKHAGLF